MQADFALDYDVLTVEQPHKVYLMARLTSGPAPSNQRRLPLNVSLVIDRSGSMAGDKINYTKQAAQFMVQNLSSRDRLSIVLYNEAVEILMPPEAITRKDAITQLIGKIKTGGTTNLSGGWLEGCNQVARNLKADALNRVILMSDGLANRGITNMSKLVALAQQKREQGIGTTTMGLGADFNEDLLMAMADVGGGAFYFIETPEVAPLIFEEELRGLLSIVGQNLVASIEMTTEVTAVHQLNAYPTSTNGKRTSFRLGDVFGEEVKTLVLELQIPALKRIGQHQIAVLRFDYDEIAEQGTTHRTLELPVMVNVAPTNELPGPANIMVQQLVLLLQAAQARREAITAADKGQYQDAAAALRLAAERIEQSSLSTPELTEERLALLKQADEMERGAEYYNEYRRKSMSTQAHYSMTDRHEGTLLLRTREMKRIVKSEPVERKEGLTPAYLNWNDRVFPLANDLIRVGRAPQNEIVIDGRSVSRFHCQIKREGEKLVIEDLGSTNGTFVNEARLRERYTLSVGDVIRMGDEEIIFQDKSH